MSENTALERFRAPNSVLLALAWASLMFLYIYNDYFSLYVPGTIDEMTAGRMGPLGPATPGVLVGVSTLLAIPSLMILLSVALPTTASRWLNLGFAVAYTVVEVLTLPGSPLFFQLVVVLEIALTSFIAWRALRWPKEAPADPGRRAFAERASATID
jgi:hypothetical protein